MAVSDVSSFGAEHLQAAFDAHAARLADRARGSGADLWKQRRDAVRSGAEPGACSSLEHRHLVLAEDLPEFLVGEDLTAVLRVLQIVRPDVVSDLADHLGPGQGFAPTTAASSFDGCSGFWSALDLPPPAL